jgi:23S rRNA (adenine2030-N6)-methyltransferase
LLSYQHDYHAGNHADVLKHWLLIECLLYMQKKDSGFDYIDTHAGSGWYRLDSPLALRNAEFRSGIARLLETPIAEMESYLRLVRDPVSRNRYPGSAALVSELLRAQDRAWLYEMHPQAFKELRHHCERKRQVFVLPEDGFKGLLARLPVASQRALVLIDPAYELKEDYQKVVTTLEKAWQKMPRATYLLWYPVVDAARVQRLQRELQKTRLRNVHLFELSVREAGAAGMTGSGVISINPPWALPAKAHEVLAVLAGRLADDGVGSSRSLCLVPE